MTEIKAIDVKNLREKTGAGMMDCKKALNETNGDFEQAVDWLRKKGLSAASKKSGRVAAEGVIASKADNTEGIIIELNAETDFVARNDKFQALANGLLDIAMKEKGSLEAILKANFPGTSHDSTLEITNNIAIIGENINLRRAHYLSVNEGVVASYLHNSITEKLGKIGVLVALESKADKTALLDLGKKISMHIAAMNPEALTAAEVDPTKLAREKEIFSEQAAKSGKPESIIEKMVEGRVRKYYEEVVLLEQIFVMDNKSKISELLENEGKKLGSSIILKAFVRYELGAGIEQESKDFAAEVAMLSK